jgi:membrane protease YdiL (CAAX protease family)
MFFKISYREVVLISVVAGIGEELLFRGVIQPTIDLIPASVIFGIAHFGGRGMLVFEILTGLIGLIFGCLAITSGGLLASIVAHAGYDAIALTYIREGEGLNVLRGSGNLTIQAHERRWGRCFGA